MRRNCHPIGLLFVGLLFGCTPQASPDPPPLPSSPSSPSSPPLVGTPPTVVVAQAPPPEQDENGPPSAVDSASGPPTAVAPAPQPPRFDAVAWLAERGVTEPLPADTTCEEALPAVPDRPDMLWCSLDTQVSSTKGDWLQYVYFAHHAVVLAVVGKKLRKMFDVNDTLVPFDRVKRGPYLGPEYALQLIVRVEDNGAVIIVEDTGKPNCAEAIAYYGGDPLVAPRRQFVEKLCKARGRYVFSKGGYVKKQ